MTDVKWTRLQHQGTADQVLQRQPASVDGAKWTSVAEFFGVKQEAVNFGTPPTNAASVTVAVSDGQVLASSVILVSIAVGVGRDSDELEMDPVIVGIGKITPGSGYDVIVSPANPGSVPTGAYLLNHARM